MIRLNRERTAAAIPAEFRGDKRIARELKLFKDRRQWLKEGSAGTFPLNSSLWKGAKKQLAKETGDKCAYCEASARTVCHCDVEHVRPKSIYWWLALCYDNYVIACQLCNQTYKGDQYPVKGPSQAGPALTANSTDPALNTLIGQAAPDPFDPLQTITPAAFAAAAQKEKPALIDPYFEDPQEFFVWEPDADHEEVWVRPRPKRGHKKWRATQCIDLLGLNREELLRVRWRAYQPVALNCEIFQSGLLDANPILKAKTQASLIASMDTRGFFAGLFRWTIREQFGLAL